MVKNNYSLEYYAQYDYIQKNTKSSIYNNGSVSRIRVSFIDKIGTERNLNVQMKIFLSTFIINECFPRINKQVKNIAKGGDPVENFFLDYTYTNNKEILSFLKYMYFESMVRNLSKNVRLFTSKNNNIIRLTIPVDGFMKVNDISNFFSIDLKQTVISFEFYVGSPIENKNEIKNIFPFWMNG